MSVATARQKLEEAEVRLHALRVTSKELREAGPLKQKRLRELKADIKSVKEHAKQACIKFRNDYARPTIQRQFAEGIRE